MLWKRYQSSVVLCYRSNNISLRVSSIHVFSSTRRTGLMIRPYRSTL